MQKVRCASSTLYDSLNMRTIELFRTGALSVRWPIHIDGMPVGDPGKKISNVCIKNCGPTPKCLAANNKGENICQFNMSYFSYAREHGDITVYGVIGPKNKTKTNRYNREGRRGRTISVVDLEKWMRSVTELEARIKIEFAERQAEMLDPLHDPIRLAKIVQNTAESALYKYSTGKDIEDLLKNAPAELKTLLKASELLSDSFDLVSIYFNPSAATYGRKTAISMHGLLVKLVAIFRIDDGETVQNNVKVFLSGQCYRSCFAHDSLKLIPFALLSNATKYCMVGNVNVVIRDNLTGVLVSVDSTGPLIESSELQTIFEKRYRGKFGKQVTDGRGVGLFLASTIASAHGFAINAQSVATNQAINGIPTAKNTFSFEMQYDAD